MTSASRKLALMFTDIVGYSKIADSDEEASLKILSRHDEILSEIIMSHNGRVVKHIGDSIFASFVTSGAALNSSIEIQHAIAEANRTTQKKDQFQIRIGLHYGDAIEKSGDLFGSDVNISNRIEGISLPDQITISKDLLDSLESTDGYYYRAIGDVKLKNISDPVYLYHVYLSEDQMKSQTSDELMRVHHLRGTKIIEDIESYVPRKVESLAVAYPINIGAKEEEFFCYGFADTLINKLQRVPDIRVPDMMDVVRSKSVSTDPIEQARDLDVVKFLQATVLKVDTNIKIDIRIIDTSTGQSILRKVYDTNEEKYQQDSVAILRNIISTLSITIAPDLSRQLFGVGEIDPQIYSLHIEAKYLSDTMESIQDLDRSETLLQSALKIDPKLPYTHALLAMTYNLKGMYQDCQSHLEKALDYSDGIQDDNTLATIYNYFGIYYKGQSNYKKAIEYFEHGIDAQQHIQDEYQYAKIHNNLGGCYRGYGTITNDIRFFDKAIDSLTESVSIKNKIEEFQMLGNSYAELGVIYKTIGRFTEAIEYLEMAKYRYEKESMNFKMFQTIVLLSEIYNVLGMHRVSYRYLDSYKEPILAFNNLSLQSRFKTNYSITLFNDKQIERAIKLLQSSVDINFTRGKNKEAVIPLYISAQYYESIGEYSKALNQLERALSISTMLNDRKWIEKERAFRIYLDSCIKSDTVKQSIEEFVIEYDDIETLQYICRAHINIGSDTADMYHDLVSDILDNNASKITDEGQRDSYLSSNRNRGTLSVHLPTI